MYGAVPYGGLPDDSTTVLPLPQTGGGSKVRRTAFHDYSDNKQWFPDKPLPTKPPKSLPKPVPQPVPEPIIVTMRVAPAVMVFAAVTRAVDIEAQRERNRRAVLYSLGGPLAVRAYQEAK